MSTTQRERRRFLRVLIGTGAVVSFSASLPGSACAATVRQNFPLNGPVSRVRMSGGYEVELIQGDTPSLVVEGASAALNHFDYRVDGDLLVLKHRGFSWWFNHDGDAKVTLTLPRLTEVEVDGSTDLKAARWVAGEGLTLEVSGAADCRIRDLEVPRFTLHLSGTGDIEVAGRVPVQEVHISGAGDYKAAQLRSDTVDLHLSGAADVEVWAIERLDANISGTADVKYYGRPQVTRSISGAASVESGGDAPPGVI